MGVPHARHPRITDVDDGAFVVPITPSGHRYRPFIYGKPPARPALNTAEYSCPTAKNPEYPQTPRQTRIATAGTSDAIEDYRPDKPK